MIDATQQDGVRSGRLAATVCLLSMGVLEFEVALMRMLLVASWHHFAFVVISMALLGFGASGPLLSFLRPVVRRRPTAVVFAACVATAVTMPACTALAWLIPVEARIIPALLARQLAAWCAFWLLLLVPFLCGATGIGATMMIAGPRMGRIYGANLAGSGAGAILAPLAMAVIHPQWLPASCAGPALAAALPLLHRGRPTAVAALVLPTAGMALWLWHAPPHIRIDPYKSGAHVQRLVDQGHAQRIAVTSSSRDLAELYRGPRFHDLPFMSPLMVPPAMHALVIDGHAAGSVLAVESADQAQALDHTLMAVPYDLLGDSPRVLLLGEAGGVNVWLARRRGAVAIDVVQPDPRLVDMVGGLPANTGGSVFDAPGVRHLAMEPRHAVEHAGGRYDLVLPSTLLALPAGSGGMAGLGEDHLVTVEGMAACLDRLRPRGLLTICRGIQVPPRDNLKLLATLVEALRRRGIEQPHEHVIIVRDFLGVCTMVRPEPFTLADGDRVRAVCHARQLTPVWFPGVRKEELNQPDALPGPPDRPGVDWYHHAAGELFSSDPQAFIDRWQFDIRPATDDRPFFSDFCKLRATAAMRRSYGDLWLTRAEIGFLFVLATMAAIAAAGLMLTLLPVLLMPSVRQSPGKLPVAGYFAAIGLAYLMLEMQVLAGVAYLLGDTVRAAAVTIGTFLVFSGLGSITADAMRGRRIRLAPIILALVVVGTGVVWLVSRLPGLAGDWPAPARDAVTVAVIAPLAFLMGLPMPTGLACVHARTPALVPWAWGVNGFAGVLAASLATAIAMKHGYLLVAIIALALYLAAAAAFPLVQRPPRSRPPGSTPVSLHG